MLNGSSRGADRTHRAMRVFLTGGTGLLGSHLAEHLVSRGHEVRALVRPSSDASFLEEIGSELVEGDVTDPVDRLAGLIVGCTHLVHGAALVYAGGSWESVAAVNVAGTTGVLSAGARSGVKKAVHISSVAVYSSREGGSDEAAPLNHALADGDHYARSKREAEGEARRVERETGLPVSVVRPSAVYGERDRLMAPAVAGILRLPLVPLFGPGDNTLPVVYAGNVAVAIRQVMESPTAGDTYDLGMDHPLTQRALFEAQARGMGLHPRFVRLPGALVGGGARILARLGVGTPGAQHLSLERVARLALGENPYVSRRAHDDLGWDPPHSHRDALERTGRWISGRPDLLLENT